MRLVRSCILAFVCLLPHLTAQASDALRLQEEYQALLNLSKESSVPFTLVSTHKRGVSDARVGMLINNITFKNFTESLRNPAEWCEFIPIHLNVKACATLQENDNDYLRFYIGVKEYQRPTHATLLELKFESELVDDVLKIEMTADSGPYASSDYLFQLTATEVDEGIFTEFYLSSRPGYLSTLATIYLETIARKKIGFTIDGKTWTGKPKYVNGQRGATERNVVRYMLAIQSYFETLNVKLEDRFQARIEHWYDSTLQHTKQLYEMDKESYLDAKNKERKNQEILVEAIKAGKTPIFPSEVER